MGRVSTCKKNCKTIDLRGAQVNELETTHIWVWKITDTCNPKMIFKMCEGISCSSFSVKELDVIVHRKNIFLV